MNTITRSEKSENRAVIGAVACQMVCVSMFVLALAIPSVIFAIEDEDSACQKGTRGGLNLSDWLKGFGLEKIILTGVLYVSLALGLAHEALLIPGFIAIIADIFFTVIWWIWGVVILATNENNKCVAQGKSMGVMAIINLVLFEVSLGYAVALGALRN